MPSHMIMLDQRAVTRLNLFPISQRCLGEANFILSCDGQSGGTVLKH
jgi:hypothetical protein